ncbi:protein regulator of cytokinesis 1-like isoform X3 [Periplaneta americana]|uniref:protein regulator of cytokinesis 1-like isoform X3 n=1 Tax=Periplaneta americana TaxID=6978 RepID=UPI0037E85922
MAGSLVFRKFDHVKEELTKCIESFMSQFACVWEECGYNKETIEQRCESIKTHHWRLFEDMLEEEQETKTGIIKKIENYLKEASELSQDLGVHIEVTGYESLPLCDVERSLRNKIENYRKVKEQRMEKLSRLQHRERVICDTLDIQPSQDFANKVPTEQQLEEFEAYINEKNEEKARLLQVFQDTKSTIINLMTELEIVPSLQFEKLVVCEQDSVFRLTKENMTSLRQLHQRLERQLEETKAEATELREKLSLLWDRLHEDYRHREELLSTHRGHSTSTLRALKEELKRCEELKRQNIKRFVEEIRKELKQWWDNCCVGEMERANFLPFSSDCYTEDLLELHELEVEKYRSHYNENMVIFELANKRQELWDKMLELEDRANDPNRLFHNRGGQLLLEEKERKNIQKELPKVEKELCKYIELYEEKSHKPFKFHGERVIDIINKQWEAHKNNKEQQKMAKKVARDHLLEVESKLGSQSRAAKRKIVPATPAPSSVKQRKVIKNDGTCATEKHFRPKPCTTDHLEVLNQEGTCRSSVVPGRCLRERNMQVVTPLKTPSKIPSKLFPTPGTAIKSTPQSRATPIKPPRKNVTGQQSTTKTSRTIPRLVRGTQNSPMYQRGIATAPRLTTPRGKLPIII